MRITESKLRRIIRSVIEESWRKHSKIDSIRQNSLNSKVQDKINYYKDNPDEWHSKGARYQFHNMLAGGSGGVIEYAEDDVTPIKTVRDGYPGWENDEFEAVVNALGG
tara:strand:+ start:187 stop:510 length:324 start_codon:yes stop_codon:yes gene_type:complete